MRQSLEPAALELALTRTGRSTACTSSDDRGGRLSVSVSTTPTWPNPDRRLQAVDQIELLVAHGISEHARSPRCGVDAPAARRGPIGRRRGESLTITRARAGLVQQTTTRRRAFLEYRASSIGVRLASSKLASLSRIQAPASSTRNGHSVTTCLMVTVLHILAPASSTSYQLNSACSRTLAADSSWTGAHTLNRRAQSWSRRNRTS
jgi:hypothetical protein